MRPSCGTPALFLFTTLISWSNALKSNTNSPCAVQCGNVLDGTTGADIVCTDLQYSTAGPYATASGTTFQTCVSCQLTSTYVDPGTHQTDLQWALYNMRYAMSWCLWGYPDNAATSSTPCTTSFSCGPLESSIEFDSLSLNATQYGYCPSYLDFESKKCSECLYEQGGTDYLANFATALDAGCIQQPVAGSTLSLQGSVFSLSKTNITSPSATPISSFTPQHGLTLAAKVGIAISGVIVFLILLGCGIICIGRRRRRHAIAEHQRQTGYSTWVAEQKSLHSSPPQMSAAFQATFHDGSPLSQRPLWGAGSSREDESPASALGAGPAYFSPYSSQYSSPISALDQVALKGREWPSIPPTERKGSTGGNGGGMQRSTSMEKRFFPGMDDEGDRIELRDVTSVLAHPGNGRGSPPSLGEHHVMMGTAL